MTPAGGTVPASLPATAVTSLCPWCHALTPDAGLEPGPGAYPFTFHCECGGRWLAGADGVPCRPCNDAWLTWLAAGAGDSWPLCSVRQLAGAFTMHRAGGHS